jgi:hypothetical protein
MCDSATRGDRAAKETQTMAKRTGFSAKAMTLAGALALATAGCGGPKGEAADEAQAAADEPAPQAESSADEGDDEQGEVAHNHPDHDHPDHVHGDDEDVELADDLEAGATAHYGAAFSDPEADPLAIGDALAQCVGTGEPCKIQGAVKTVCESRGCWMELDAPADAGRIVRVRMLDYGFFLPRNVAGAEAIVEGTLEETEITEDRARHYAEKGSGDLEAIDGPQPEYRIVASGIELSVPES